MLAADNQTLQSVMLSGVWFVLYAPCMASSSAERVDCTPDLGPTDSAITDGQSVKTVVESAA